MAWNKTGTPKGTVAGMTFKSTLDGPTGSVTSTVVASLAD
jgi:hypothetical protein